MGSWLQPASSNCADWFQPDNGSGDAWLSALRMLSRGGQHPELESVPWVLWGHSGGAHWSVLMAAKYPERVVAVFAQSGGVSITNYAALEVPMIFNRGADDLTNVIKSVDALFNSNRRADALWSLAINPKAKHDCHNGRQLAIPFFDTMLGQRLSVAPGKPELRPTDKAHAWLGDVTTFDVAAEVAFKGNRNKAAWLPNENLAHVWQEFMKAGAVTDRTPPPAPTKVQAMPKSALVHLHWSAEADMESGIKLFNIYRDGTRVGSTGGPEDSAAKGNFQAGNYGDEPEPANPEMFYIDSAIPPGPHSYQVTTVNWADLESPKSVAVEVELKNP
jgi:pimeloyl-ACP methyl ester carboxylesterase